MRRVAAPLRTAVKDVILMCHCFGVLGEAVSWIDIRCVARHCLTEDRQAVAPFSVAPAFSRRKIYLRYWQFR